MGITYCDKCHFEWQVQESDIKAIELDVATGARMRYFQCPECGAEYIVDVTDFKLRDQIAQFKKMQKKYQRMYRNRESETRLRNYLGRIESKRKELLVGEKVLRRKWTSGE